MGCVRNLAVVLASAAALHAQNYGSHMNSAERAREAQRYESALLHGTYNNPMLQKSTVDMSLAMRGLGQAQRDEDAAKLAKQQAEQQRRYDEQRQREQQAATEAYYRARQEEARRKRQEFERNFAAIGMRRWGFQDLVATTDIAQDRERVRTGQSGAIPRHELYATALAVRRNPLPPVPGAVARSPEYPVAQLALQALAGGQLLPAVLLADDLGSDRELLRRIACEGTPFDRMLPVYYTGGQGWIADDELQLARTHGLVTDARVAEAEEARRQLKPVHDLSTSTDPRVLVLRVLELSRLFPWQTSGAGRPSFYAESDLATLRTTRPVLGYFMTALYEERMKSDPARPSPWADFMFERAAQVAGPGFITEVARVRREQTGPAEAAALRRWRELSAAGRPAAVAELDTPALWRVAGRLILGHDLAGLSPDLADPADRAAIARRLTLAHDLLWELTTRGDRYAVTVQYVAAMQDESAARPSLLAYLNAYHWLLDWDRPPADREDTAMLAASFLETLPASRVGRHYADSGRVKAMKEAVPETLQKFPYAMMGHYSWFSTGYLEGLPLPAGIVPAVILHRNRLGAEAARLTDLGNSIRSAGFGAQLARQLQAAAARARKDAAGEAAAREGVARLVKAGSTPAAAPDPAELGRGLERLGVASLTLAGSSLLGEPLPLGAAPDSAGLLEAVAIRNLAVRPFLPHVRLLPLPLATRTGRLHGESALRRMVAAQLLSPLDASYAAAVHLPVELALRWLKAGAEQGDAPCRLRLAQLALQGGALAGATGMAAATAEKILAEMVTAGVPGAVEFQFERMRRQAKPVPPEELFAFVHAARAKGSPVAAQAWLDALDETRPWSPEQVLQETIALRVARDDMRNVSTERWWKALGRWSDHLRAHRALLVGRPEAEEVAREVARLVRQSESLHEVYPRELLYVKAYDVFPHLATASGNLPAGPAATALRAALANARQVREELRYGSFVPFETALQRARTEKDATAREFAAVDAARWFVVNNRSRVEHAGLVHVSLLPAEPDRHPLWDAALGVRWAAAALAIIWNQRARPEDFAGNIRRVAGVVERLPASLAGPDLQALVAGYTHFAQSTEFVADIRGLPEAQALVAAFDRLALRHAALAADIYRAGSRIAPRSYALACYDRTLQPAGGWHSLPRECFRQLVAADHIAHLRRIAGFDAARVSGGVTDIMDWVTDATTKAERAGDTAAVTELGAAMRQVAARWTTFSVETEDRWTVAVFQLTAEAERIAPALEKTKELLRGLQARAAVIGDSRGSRSALVDWVKGAVAAKNRELLQALAAFAPKEIEEALDELEGSPKRKAAQAEHERRRALLDPLLDMLKEGRNVGVAVRTMERFDADGMMINAWSQLQAVKAATLGAGGVSLPTEPRTFRAVLRLLASGCVSWEEYDEIGALALSLSPVAQRLWETRATWRKGREHHLMWIVRSYAMMKQPWAVAAWPTFKDNPSAELRFSLTTSGLFRELGMTSVSAEEARLPVYRDAENGQKDLPPPGDDPVAEFTALLARPQQE